MEISCDHVNTKCCDLIKISFHMQLILVRRPNTHSTFLQFLLLLILGNATFCLLIVISIIFL